MNVKPQNREEKNGQTHAERFKLTGKLWLLTYLQPKRAEKHFRIHTKATTGAGSPELDS